MYSRGAIDGGAWDWLPLKDRVSSERACRVPLGARVWPLGRCAEGWQVLPCVGDLSTSTLVSEEWLLCSDEASLSCDSLHELLDSKLLLNWFGVYRVFTGAVWRIVCCVCGCASGDTMESRMRWWLADGGETSWWLSRSVGPVSRNGRAGSGFPQGITTCILGFAAGCLAPLGMFFLCLVTVLRFFFRHWILPCLYVPMVPTSDAWLDADSPPAVLLAPVATTAEAMLFRLLPQIDVDLEGNGTVKPADDGRLPSLPSLRPSVAVL